MKNEKFIIAVVKNVFENPKIDYYLYPHQKLNINHEYDLIKSIYDITTNENIDQNNMYDDNCTNQDTKTKTETMKQKSTAEKKIKSIKVKNQAKKSKITTKLQSIEVKNQKVKPAKSKNNSILNPNVSKMISNIRTKSERKQKKKKNWKSVSKKSGRNNLMFFIFIRVFVIEIKSVIKSLEEVQLRYEK